MLLMRSPPGEMDLEQYARTADASAACMSMIIDEQRPESVAEGMLSGSSDPASPILSDFRPLVVALSRGGKRRHGEAHLQSCTRAAARRQPCCLEPSPRNRGCSHRWEAPLAQNYVPRKARGHSSFVSARWSHKFWRCTRSL